MSMDFFDRLAAAAVDPNAGIRPRAMSRFETPVENPAGDEVEQPENPAGSRSQALAETRAAAPHPSVLPASSESVRVAEKIVDRDQSRPPERTASRPEPPINPVADEPPQRTRPAERIDETIYVEHGRSDPSATRLPIPDIRPPAQQRHPPMQPPDADAQPLRTIRPASNRSLPGGNDILTVTVDAENERPSGGNAVAGMQETTAGPTRPNGDTVPPSPAAIRPRQALDVRRERGVEEPRRPVEYQPPTIEISIGNIELRPQPTADAAAPSARPRFQPTLSLDDYLARRQGGER